MNTSKTFFSIEQVAQFMLSFVIVGCTTGLMLLIGGISLEKL